MKYIKIIVIGLILAMIGCKLHINYSPSLHYHKIKVKDNTKIKNNEKCDSVNKKHFRIK